MIHSMSGGVLDGGEIYTFAKVQTEQSLQWFLVPALIRLKEGDAVIVPVGYLQERGVVVKLENATKQTAPVPLNRAKEIVQKA